MKIYSKFAAALLIMYSLSASAQASGYECKSGPISEWLPKETVLKSLVTEGYEIRKVEVEDGCYEVYALKEGKKLEIFVNPTTGVIEMKKEK